MVLVLVLLCASGASAESSYLERAREAASNLDHEQVAPLLEKALEQTDDPTEQAEIYELLAPNHIRFGRDTEARQAFVELLRRRPDYVLPAEVSPKVRSVFKQAADELAALEGQASSDEPPGTAASNPPEAGTDADTTRPAAATAPPHEEAPSMSEPSLQSRWWFWAAIAGGGAVVLSGGAATLWWLSQPQAPDTDLGPYPL